MFELKSSLSLNQSLVLTPDLKQALKILSLSELEVTALLDEELIDNVMLDESKDYDAGYYAQNLPFFEETTPDIPTLIDRLRSQLYEGDFNVIEKEIGERLLGELDEDGFIEAETIERASADLAMPNGWINSVRMRMLNFEPAGCFAVDLHECLLAQLANSCESSNAILKTILAEQNLPRCITHPQEVATLLACTPIQLQESLEKLKLFRCKPARTHNFSDHFPIQTIMPEIEVTQAGECLQVNALRSQRAHVNKDTVEKLGAFRDKETLEFVRHRIRRARWFISTLERRESTVVRVAKAIAEHQKGWFLHQAPLNPLTLKKIAVELELHESTVSRAIANKYLRCGRGIFGLRTFFVSHIASGNHTPISSDAVKLAIQKIILGEDTRIPLSDQAICDHLRSQQFLVARRTVSKYRIALKISGANRRKRP